jgi:hypothetical protein
VWSSASTDSGHRVYLPTAVIAASSSQLISTYIKQTSSRAINFIASKATQGCSRYIKRCVCKSSLHPRYGTVPATYHTHHCQALLLRFMHVPGSNFGLAIMCDFRGFTQLLQVTTPTSCFFFFLARQAPVGQSLLIHEVSRSHTTTHQSR